MKSASIFLSLLILGCTAPKSVSDQNLPSSESRPKELTESNTNYQPLKLRFQPPQPNYSPEELHGLHGVVKLIIMVGIDGIPTDAKLIEGPFELGNLAAAYAMKWRFYPALHNNKPFEMGYHFTMKF